MLSKKHITTLLTVLEDADGELIFPHDHSPEVADVWEELKKLKNRADAWKPDPVLELTLDGRITDDGQRVEVDRAALARLLRELKAPCCGGSCHA